MVTCRHESLDNRASWSRAQLRRCDKLDARRVSTAFCTRPRGRDADPRQGSHPTRADTTLRADEDLLVVNVAMAPTAEDLEAESAGVAGGRRGPGQCRRKSR